MPIETLATIAGGLVIIMLVALFLWLVFRTTRTEDKKIADAWKSYRD